MSIKKAFNFKQNVKEGLGVSSRKNSEVRSTVPQIGIDGLPLGDAVNEQSFVLDSTGKNMLKMRSAYHQNTPLCGFEVNELSDETMHQDLPLHKKKIEEFSDVASIPSEIKRSETSGRILDYLYSKTENGEVVEKAVQNEKGDWVKRKFNSPLYKARVNNKGMSFDGTLKNQKKDEKGFYELTFSKYTYFANASVGIFNGHQVDEGGKMVKNSEGTYLVPTQFKDNDTVIPMAQKSGAKFSIESKINKVLTHPIYGVVDRQDVSDSGYLSTGKFELSADGVSVAIYDDNGKVAQTFNDRPCFRIGNFRAKGTKAKTEVETVVENVVETTKANTEDAIKEVAKSEGADKFVL